MDPEAARKLLEAHLTDLDDLRLIGQGSFALVFRARQPGESRSVAVKLLDASQSSAAREKERFALEIRFLERLNHPNVVQIFDFGKVGSYDYLIMELVEGKNLKETLKHPIGPRLLLEIFRGIARGLSAVHAGELLHRDLKPENILIGDGSGVPKITDFGLAKSMVDPDPSLTAAGMCLGTPVYMAPEACLAREVTPAADIYSLGVMLYEALSGKPPFVADNEMDVFRMHVKSAAAPIPPRGDPVFDGLSALALACLRKEPELRPKDGADVLARLDRIEQGRSPENQRSLRLKVQRHLRGRLERVVDFSLWKGLAAGMLTGLLGILLLAWGTRPEHLSLERGSASVVASWATRWSWRGRAGIREATGDWRHMEGGRGNLHRLELTDLTPETTYHVRIVDALGWFGDEAEVSTLPPLVARTGVRCVPAGWEVSVHLDRPARLRLERAGKVVATAGETEVTSWDAVIEAPEGPLKGPGALTLSAESRREAPLRQEISTRTLLQCLGALTFEKDVGGIGSFAWAPLEEVEAVRMAGLDRGTPRPLHEIWELARAEEPAWIPLLQDPANAARLAPHLATLGKLSLIDRAAGLWGFPRRFDAWTDALARAARPVCRSEPPGNSAAGGVIFQDMQVRLLQPKSQRNLSEVLMAAHEDGAPRASIEGEIEVPAAGAPGAGLCFWVQVDRLEPQVALRFELTADAWSRSGYLHDGCSSFSASRRDPAGMALGPEQMENFERKPVSVGVRFPPGSFEGKSLRYRIQPESLPGCILRVPPTVFRVGLTWTGEDV